MRHIGSISDSTSAQRFGDYLRTLGIQSKIEEGSSGWSVWVEDEDQLERSKQELDQYHAAPNDPRYAQSTKVADRIRKETEQAQVRRRKNFIDYRTSSATHAGKYSVTLSIIVLCGITYAMTWFQRDQFLMNNLKLFPSAVLEGQVWRIITPIFLHFGPLHFIFNMFWLRDFGFQIESRRGAGLLLLLVLVSAVVGNVAQLFWAGPNFGGMSGVVYGLFGYVWIKGIIEPHRQMGVYGSTPLIMIVWLILCAVNIIPGVANAAHIGGFAVGILAAWGPYKIRKLLHKGR